MTRNSATSREVLTCCALTNQIINKIDLSFAVIGGAVR